MKPILKQVGIGVGSGITVAVFTFILLTSMFATTPIATITLQQSSPHSDLVVVTIRRNGEIIYRYETHNIIVTGGATWVKDFLQSGTTGATNATDDISMSADPSPQTSWTKLPSEITTGGLARKTADTVSAVNSTAYWANATWTATASFTINCTGLHHDPTPGSDGNLVAAATIDTATLIANDEIEIDWLVNVPPG